ncbi:MAG: hypothetical protein FJ265_04465 [Planctomycetes bacterium]|nr:hypothetical protein [Planctomycetota bacterium]
MLRHLLRLLPLALLAACGGHHPLDGAWNQELADGSPGMHITFETTGDKVDVGLPPRADRTHGHAHGTYTFDAASAAVVVVAKLLGDGKADTWNGKLAGDRLELGSADGKLTFRRAERAHGH